MLRYQGPTLKYHYQGSMLRYQDPLMVTWAHIVDTYLERASARSWC